MFKRPTPANLPHNALNLVDCLAKTYADQQQGRDVLSHCTIVGAVAKELIKRMPAWLRADLFPTGSELIAACHDIGKVSPTFQRKLYDVIKEYKEELKDALPEDEKQWGGHAGVSQATAKNLKLGKFIPEILGQHHGYSPSVKKSAECEDFGGETWQQRRVELIAALKIALDCDFPQLTLQDEYKAVVLSGLTTVADWIGSSWRFDDPTIDWQPLIKQTLDNEGFIAPTLKKDLSFFDIFGFQPHDSQTQLIKHTNQQGVYVLEAPMGHGKTEAALYAAYQLLSQEQATGLYFALPTQLTSDKIHDRVNAFLQKVLAENSPHQKALLAHGNAWLYENSEMGGRASPEKSWFDDKKRRILAPFAVGTIDQALMAVMNVKHGFVRSFGLAGKVVILDEVHSYDMYTGTILDALVEKLQQWHCTVIILSATLTQQRREKLLQQSVCATNYPLISAKAKHADFQELPITPLPNHAVSIFCCQNDDDALNEALERAKQGQQVLWIENTVAEAQEIFKVLASNSLNTEIGLLHSRFLKTDREENEKKWVELYGKDNAEKRQKTGRILVGTQVLEQSLDIDADFLISRFAPTDMLLQRLGRLWRHENTVRSKDAKREAWLLVPELNAAIDNAKQAFGKTAKVYAPYVLCRSLEVWHNKTSISLPEHIREFIEATYCERAEQGAMQGYKAALEKKRDELKNLAEFGLSKAGKTLPESAATRYSEQDSTQVLLLKGYRHFSEQQATEVTLLNGDKHLLPKNLKFYDKSKWRELAATILKNTVQVASHLAPQALSNKELYWLREFTYLGKPEMEESLLRVAIVDESDAIKNLIGGVALEGYQLSYNNRLGYQSEK